MKWFWQKKEQKGFQDVLTRLILSQEGKLSASVTPDNCMRSPTVHAIVTAISRRLASTPIHIYEKGESQGRESKERLPNHPVANLLRKPNQWQSPYDFWQDATSVFIRWGRFIAYKSRGSTGPIRELLPLSPAGVDIKQDDSNWQVMFRLNQNKKTVREYTMDQMFYARGPARDFLKGDSPVDDVKTAIALEILTEKFGANFFKNGALPLLFFAFSEGSAGFATKEQEDQFIKDLNEAFGGDNMLSSMLLPKGIDKPGSVAIDHEKMQMIESRKYQRTVIAGAFGVPMHLVGDLERATFNNVEQQDQDFTMNCVMPVAKAFEAAMERDLFTDADRRANRIIRFNLDSTLRAAFKERQEGLQIQRINGIIDADEWREIEGRNPRSDQLGDRYLHPANMVVDGEENANAPNSAPGDQTTQRP